MRVAIVHHQYKLKGGMESYLFSLINGFNQAHDNVTAFVYKCTDRPASLCEIKLKKLGWLPRPLRKFWFGATVNQQTKKNHDLKISLMRSLNSDILICGGTHKSYLSFAKKRPTLLDKMEINFEQKSYASATFIMAHSSMLRDELISLYRVPENKIVMCYPPIDTQRFHSETQFSKYELRNHFGISQQKKALLFPSTGHKRIGFHLLQAAMKLLPEDKYELVIAGDKPKQKQIANINYVGFIEDMPSLYKACDLTVLPSLYEPFGLVVVESIQCGTPVIISDHVGAKDIISDDEGMVISNITPENLAEGIEIAAGKNYNIAPYFAEKNNLTIGAHIKKIKSLINGKS